MSLIYLLPPTRAPAKVVEPSPVVPRPAAALVPFTKGNLHRIRRYDAAIPSNTQSDWLAWATSGNYEILHGWRRTCFLARDLERNNPHAKAFLRELCSNVLGATGIKYHSKVKNLKGPNYNDKLNKTLQDGWKEFRRRGIYDVTGQNSGLDADRLILRALARDGEVLIRLIRGFRGNRFRFAVQLLEADALDIWYNALLTEGKRVSLGVALDNYGKPTAYNLLDYFQQDVFAANSYTARRIRVEASDVVHVYLQERITQVRGITWFTPVETKCRILERYEEALAVSNRIAASKMGFLERTKDAPRYEGQGQAETGEIIEEVSPGEVVELPPGYSFKPFDPSNPTETYADFRKNTLRSISSGLGIQYNTLANDLESVNYASARFGQSKEVEYWRELQRFFSEHVMQPIFEAWFETAILADALPDVGFDQLEQIGSSAIWKPRGWAFVDPVKDLQASLGAIDGGLSTRRRELAEQGLELEDVIEELVQEKELIEAAGLDFINPFSKMPAVEPTQEGEAPEAGTGPTGLKPAAKPNGAKPVVKPVAKPVAVSKELNGYGEDPNAAAESIDSNPRL